MIVAASPPVGRFSSSSRPPWALTRLLAIARPRPVPPLSREREDSSRTKGVMPPRGARRPGPSSLMRMRAGPSRAQREQCAATVLDGVVDKILDGAAQRIRLTRSPGCCRG